MGGLLIEGWVIGVSPYKRFVFRMKKKNMAGFPPVKDEEEMTRRWA
jgi:hypothetical protein